MAERPDRSPGGSRILSNERAWRAYVTCSISAVPPAARDNLVFPQDFRATRHHYAPCREGGIHARARARDHKQLNDRRNEENEEKAEFPRATPIVTRTDTCERRRHVGAGR